MKRLCIFMFGMVLFLSINGCQTDNAQSGLDGRNSAIEGGVDFPVFLAGTWKSDKNGWEIVLEKDGSISSVVHTIARVRLKPDEVTKVPMKEEGEGIFMPGEWAAYYQSKDRRLTVDITLDSFKNRKGTDIVEGSSMDTFVGSVSEDGKQWQAEWFSYPEYFVTTGEYDQYQLPEDPNENPKGVLIFSKVEQSK